MGCPPGGNRLASCARDRFLGPAEEEKSVAATIVRFGGERRRLRMIFRQAIGEDTQNRRAGVGGGEGASGGAGRILEIIFHPFEQRFERRNAFVTGAATSPAILPRRRR